MLKNAWSVSGCPPESIFYAIINRLQEGDDIPILHCIAEFVDGGDVMIGGMFCKALIPLPKSREVSSISNSDTGFQPLKVCRGYRIESP